jgi:hypothetical protein
LDVEGGEAVKGEVGEAEGAKRVLDIDGKRLGSEFWFV